MTDDVIDLDKRRKRPRIVPPLAKTEAEAPPRKLTGRSAVPDLSVVVTGPERAHHVFVPNARDAHGWGITPAQADEFALELIRFAEQARIEQDEENDPTKPGGRGA